VIELPEDFRDLLPALHDADAAFGAPLSAFEVGEADFAT